MKLKTLFGPVPSRRLGFSLGIDLVPFKVCSMDCIYCQLGGTTKKTVKRECHVSSDEILDEWKRVRNEIGDIDCIALAGSGEPTLNSHLGKLIEKLRDGTEFPIAVLTNGSLLFQRDVREELLNAHIVLPSLDAVTPRIFEIINRPYHSLAIKEIIEGLQTFRSVYKGKMWLEIMLVKGMNDSETELEHLRETIRRIGPDKVQLNTVVRPGNRREARPVKFEELKRIQRYLGKGCEIITAAGKQKKVSSNEDLEEAILSMIRRHPSTISEIIQSLGRKREEIISCVERLHDRNVIEISCYQGRKYCKVRRESLVSQERS
jgi:wyosine [tRNA(Phe)-imidazoG37] synthetase (radical SAM superfamily)